MCEHDASTAQGSGGAGAAGKVGGAGEAGMLEGVAPAPGVRAVVRRCVCSGTTFEEVNQMLRRGLALGDVTAKTGAGAGCGACGPYLRLVQRSGRTAFAVLPPEVLRRLDQGP
ncbi:MAG: hypothetical protein C0475_02545 [Planctomyces sp.]|nr:hypothetical protein [Planctomyces sp.]MBA4120750.1 hypothetical protein [Isosphaera sp.]